MMPLKWLNSTDTALRPCPSRVITMKPWIVGNWKMHGSKEMIASYVPEFLDAFLESGDLSTRVRAAICPPYPYLFELSQLMTAYPMRVGAQNVNQNASGAHTGEVSAAMLSDLGVDLCIVGHSERRHIYGEASALIGEKVQALLGVEIKPLICVGETQPERDSGSHKAVVEAQLDAAMAGLSAGQGAACLIGYEPVWAIGTGLTATPVQAQEMHAHIRKWLAGRFGDQEGKAIPILYGGSVTPDNAKALLSQQDVNGALVGGASLKTQDFVSILKQIPA